jgi:peptidyl-dipeptidase Dcp
MKRRTFLFAAGAAMFTGSTGFRPAWSAPETDPILSPWTGPYGGLPPFDRIRPELFPAAFSASMNDNRVDLRLIVDHARPATFANTIAALENSGRAYGRAQSLFGVYTSTLNDKQVQAINRDWAPKFSAFADEIVQNPQLFARIEAVYNGPEKASLTPEQQRLSWYYHNNFVRAGARLHSAQKAELSHLNEQLASLYTKFSQNELFDEENGRLVLASEADLVGLPDWLKASAATAADSKGLKGKWLVSNTRSSMEPFLTYSDRRDLRRRAFELWIKRGDNGGEHDNNAIVTQILLLRARRAKLLGFPTHAHWRLEDSMAKTPERAMALMLKVWPSAKARVREEVADMQKLTAEPIEPWDYRYYAEKVRKARYDLDENLIKPYLQLDKLREGVFWAAGQLYGFEFAEVHDVPRAHPDIRTFVVNRNGQQVGFWYWDPYARDGKDSGAWMNEYRSQEKFLRPVLPIVSNNSNFVKGKPGEVVLISWDDGITMFHEFGHAIHGLNSNVNYPSLAGTNTARDFVEFPSQLNENWLSTPEVLSRFALHYQTGQPMPADLVARIHRAATFNQGFNTVEYLSSAIMDMKLHLAGEVSIDPHEFEKRTLAELGMPPQIVMRHRIPQFGHIFSGDGYSAGYYSYLWSEVLDHDAYQAFMEAGGPYDKTVAKRLHDCILQVGNTVDPAQAYRNFRGRDASIVPLLKFRGFPVS